MSSRRTPPSSRGSHPRYCLRPFLSIEPPANVSTVPPVSTQPVRKTKTITLPRNAVVVDPALTADGV